MYGSESNSAILKKITARYFAEKFDELREEYSELQIYFESNIDTLKSCWIDGVYSNILTVTAVANALTVSIGLVYPEINGPDDPGNEILNATIQPVDYQSPPRKIWLMMTTCSPLGPNQSFQPNHYVALLADFERGSSFLYNSYLIILIFNSSSYK